VVKSFVDALLRRPTSCMKDAAGSPDRRWRTGSTLKQSGLATKVSHISIGAAASLEFLETGISRESRSYGARLDRAVL
jgi:hypothetical protein